ncbi:MAG: DNA-3-methyladenine glycosylase [Clostridiaceae bacterium]|nr:DNA-3-methyladenine glycosylase [Clostridiaceae bacterium]
MKKIDFNKPAKELAKDLIGKVICYNGKKYMITVTEAYPFDEGKDAKGKEISYVNKYKKGSKGHDALVGEDKIGDGFVYAGMLHIACKGGYRDGETEYKCDNVLIRGGVCVDDNNELQIVDNRLSFENGKPYKLCCTLLKIPKDFCDIAESIIKDFQSFDKKYINQTKRINVDSNNEYRYYLDLNELKGNN